MLSLRWQPQFGEGLKLLPRPLPTNTGFSAISKKVEDDADEFSGQNQVMFPPDLYYTCCILFFYLEYVCLEGIGGKGRKRKGRGKKILSISGR